MVGDVGDERHVLARRETRNQVVELEDEADVLPPVLREGPIVSHGQIGSPIDHLAGTGDVKASRGC